MAGPDKSTQFFISRTVHIGNVALGGSNPIRIQSMTSTNTLNTKATVDQSIRMIEAGSELVRITTPGIKEVENLRRIKKELQLAGYNVPLIADIHFNPKVAEYAAQIVEKIRINPGNYTGSGSKNKSILNEAEYQFEVEKTAENLFPLLKICKENGTVIRLGVNHGSLSQRIINKYGNTPTGMVASVLEFIHICENFHFNNLVLSMKSSNLKIMVQAYRLLVSKMLEEKMNYPLHLGVTEAGNGLEGRIKSTAGIGTLLQEGIGDTIRVSLTEDPENEIVFAKSIVKILGRTQQKTNSFTAAFSNINPFEYHRRKSSGRGIIGNGKPPVVISSQPNTEADFCFDTKKRKLIGKELSYKIIDALLSKEKVELNDVVKCAEIKMPINFQNLGAIINKLNLFDILLIKLNSTQTVYEVKKLVSIFMDKGIQNPVVIKKKYSESDFDQLTIQASTDFGSLLIDGLIDGIWIDNDFFKKDTDSLSFKILQASGSRISSTEFIACPSCGRTKFDIQKAFEEVKKATHHLTGLKIAVMGCVVNGPGEMADANYGYIGAGAGKVNLYKSGELIKKGVDEKEAVTQLVSLIKECGDWKDQ